MVIDLLRAGASRRFAVGLVDEDARVNYSSRARLTLSNTLEDGDTPNYKTTWGEPIGSCF